MKEQLTELLKTVIETLRTEHILADDFSPKFTVERTRDPAHGDLATNLALVSAKAAGMNPRQMAELVVKHLPDKAFNPFLFFRN